jgi:hypothetical protein
MFAILAVGSPRGGPAPDTDPITKEQNVSGLDGRHRNENGRIERKRGDTKIENLKNQYPELKRFPGNATLRELRDRFAVDTLDGLLRVLRRS